MRNVSVLVVEDDRAVRNLMIAACEKQGYTVFSAADGRTALEIAAGRRPRVILLDLGLPDMDGTEIIGRIRTWSRDPIIVVSARAEETDKIEALDAGADDYLTKPFGLEELLARMRVALRRMEDLGLGAGETTFRTGGLIIDYAAAEVTLDGEPVHLTPIEYRLLCVLARHAGRVLTHNYIIKTVWGEGYDRDTPSLRVFMATLRKKLEKDPAHPRYLQTHIGIGYRLMRG